MKHPSLLLFLSFLPFLSRSQDIGIKLSNNVSSFPISGIPQLVSSRVHPGIDLFYQTAFKEREKSYGSFTHNLGWMHHRHIQNALRLNSTVSYNRILKNGWDCFVGFGIGYWHSFYQYDIFKINESGVYEASRDSRAQFSGNLAIGVTKEVGWFNERPARFIIEYRPYVHGVFANAYVPIIPYNSLAVGFKYKLLSN